LTERAPKPRRNGSEFENYVVDDISRIFRPHITLGNIITVGTLLVTATLFYASLKAHLSNADIHHTRQQIDAQVDERLSLKLSTNDYRLQQVEIAVREAATAARTAAETARDAQVLIDQKGDRLDRKLNKVLEGTPHR
jgi:hypothetical protein